jgi:hypothetical protein
VKRTCRAITPPSTDACGKPASRLVTFPDEQKEPTCPECSLQLVELARVHGTTLKVEPL